MVGRRSSLSTVSRGTGNVSHDTVSRDTVSRGTGSDSTASRRRYSLVAMQSNTGTRSPDTAGSSSHDLRKEIERMGDDISRNYCNDRPGHPVMFPPTPQVPPHLRDTSPEGGKEDVDSAQYEAETVVYRALEDLREDLVVLHGYEYTHQQYGLYVAHECEKRDGDLEGGCAFVVVGHNHVDILDVRSPKVDGSVAGETFADCYQKSVDQRTKTSKLLMRICIKTFRFTIPSVRQLTAFPYISRFEAERIDHYSTMSDKDKNNIIFKDDLKNFAAWWSEKLKVCKANSESSEFQLALQKVKQTFLGIWSMDKENLSEKEKCGLCNSITGIDTLLEGRKTAEINEMFAGLHELLATTDSHIKVNGEASDAGSGVVHGFKPNLHLVSHRVGYEVSTLSSVVDEILEGELKKLAALDHSSKALVSLNKESSLFESFLSTPSNFKDDVRSFEEVISSEWPALLCFIDLSKVLRLSTLQAGDYLNFDVILSQLYSAVSKGRTYCSIILVIGATEVQGGVGSEMYGIETCNKTNRSYFSKTKSSLCALIETLVRHSSVKWYDTSSDSSECCTRLAWPQMKTMLDDMLAFPDKHINKETICKVSQQISAIEDNLSTITGKMNSQKVKAKGWMNLGTTCGNEDLKVVKNTIEKLQSDISDLFEVHGNLTAQLCELSKLYEEVYEEVTANID